MERDQIERFEFTLETVANINNESYKRGEKKNDSISKVLKIVNVDMKPRKFV